jgi:hypothetical protein
MMVTEEESVPQSNNSQSSRIENGVRVLVTTDSDHRQVVIGDDNQAWEYVTTQLNTIKTQLEQLQRHNANLQNELNEKIMHHRSKEEEVHAQHHKISEYQQKCEQLKKEHVEELNKKLAHYLEELERQKEELNRHRDVQLAEQQERFQHELQKIIHDSEVAKNEETVRVRIELAQSERVKDILATYTEGRFSVALDMSRVLIEENELSDERMAEVLIIRVRAIVRLRETLSRKELRECQIDCERALNLGKHTTTTLVMSAKIMVTARRFQLAIWLIDQAEKISPSSRHKMVRKEAEMGLNSGFVVPADFWFFDLDEGEVERVASAYRLRTRLFHPDKVQTDSEVKNEIMLANFNDLKKIYTRITDNG